MQFTLQVRLCSGHNFCFPQGAQTDGHAVTLRLPSRYEVKNPQSKSIASGQNTSGLWDLVFTSRSLIADTLKRSFHHLKNHMLAADMWERREEERGAKE